MAEVVLLGCGNMGMALLKSAVRCRDVDRIVVVDKRAEQLERASGMYPDVECRQTVPELEDGLLILAVKPQDVSGVAEQIRDKIGEEVSVLSVCAGITRGYLKKVMGVEHVIRAMPNTPGLISAGITGVVYEEGIPHLEVALEILKGLGEVLRLEKEEDLDVVTAISGSGPAYYFFLTEQLRDFGIGAGLSEEVAERLARRTAYGAGLLLEKFSGKCEELRRMVTSPGGTTEAAIKYMTEKGVGDILKGAFERARIRAKELAR